MRSEVYKSKLDKNGLFLHFFAHFCINLAQNCTIFALKKLLGFTQPTHSRIKEFSPVGKLPLENLEDVFIQSLPDTAKE